MYTALHNYMPAPKPPLLIVHGTGNSSVDSNDLFPLNYDVVHMKNLIVV